MKSQIVNTVAKRELVADYQGQREAGDWAERKIKSITNPSVAFVDFAPSKSVKLSQCVSFTEAQ